MSQTVTKLITPTYVYNLVSRLKRVVAEATNTVKDQSIINLFGSDTCAYKNMLLQAYQWCEYTALLVVDQRPLQHLSEVCKKWELVISMWNNHRDYINDRLQAETEDATWEYA